MIRNIGKYLYDENRLLGVGGYGKVYEGINSETKEKVAVKSIFFLFIYISLKY